MPKQSTADQLADAKELLAEIAGGLGEDHEMSVAAEGGMKLHRREEPKCSYCNWIKRAEKIAREETRMYKSIMRGA